VRICRFRLGTEDRVGVVVDGVVHDVTPALDSLPSYRYPLPHFDPLIAALPMLVGKFRAMLGNGPSFPLEELALLAPIANPGKIVAAPVNYRKHLAEAQADAAIHFNTQIKQIHEIGVFLKANSSLIGPSDPVRLAHHDRRNDHEMELALVIGKEASNVAAADALSHVAGYCIGLDMTIRGPEERSLRKSADTFTVMGPWLVTADELGDPGQLDFDLSVNGALRQKANTRDLVLSVPTLIEYASRFYTLHPGDVILTGTPEGVGPVVPGDVMTCGIEGIGRMTVQVIAA